MTVRGRIFVGAGVVIALIGMVLGLYDLTKVGVLLVVLPAIASLLVRRDLKVEVGRSLAPVRVPIDGHSDVTLWVRNVGRRSTPLLRGEEGLGYALGDRPHVLVPGLRSGESRQLTYRVRSHIRGHHPIGPLTVRMTDPFGLATRAATVPGENVLVVLPRTLPLSPVRGVPARSGGEPSSSPRMALHGEDDVGVREYRIGDDLRRIHWPSTARTGETMVRQDEEPSRRRALVVLDDRGAVHAGTGSGGSFEWSVTAVASIVTLLLGDRFEVHLYLSSDESGRVVPVDGVDQAMTVGACAELAPPPGRDDALVCGLEVVDGAGRTLLPGFIDAHTHSWGDAQRDALRFGVTAELDMFGDWSRIPALRAQRESLAATPQADLWTAGATVTTEGGHGTQFGFPVPTLGADGDARAFVDARVAEGSDYIKLIVEDFSTHSADRRLPTITPAQVTDAIVAAQARQRLALVHVASQADAQTDDSGVLADLSRCRSLSHAVHRLECFDAATARLDAAQAAGEVVVLNREQVRESERRTFGFNVSLLNPFESRGTSSSSQTLDAIESVVVSAREDGAGKWVVSLADGSIWRQIDQSSIYLRRPERQTARVRRAALGSYLMTVGSSPAFRVRRQAD